MPNKNIQCFGLYVSGRWPSEQRDFQLNPEESAVLRASTLFKAVYETIPHKANDNVLKIFMAPEFYYQDNRGATLPTEGAMGTALNTFVDLLSKNLDRLGTNWLFVLGGGNEYTNTGQVDDDGTNITPWNMTPVVMVRRNGSINIRTVLKQTTSHIDYGRNSAAYTLGGRRRPNLTVGGFTHNVPRGQDGHGFLNVDGVDVAIEVCLDYAADVIGSDPVARRAPIRLLSSGGMTFFDQNGQSHLYGTNRLNFNVDCLRPLTNAGNRDSDAVVLFRGATRVAPILDIPIRRMSNQYLFQGTGGPPTLRVYSTQNIVY